MRTPLEQPRGCVLELSPSPVAPRIIVAEPGSEPGRHRARQAATKQSAAIGHPLAASRKRRLALALGVEFDRAFDHGKDRVVLADADASARVPLSAALTHEDIAGDDVLTPEVFYAKPLGMGVAVILR